MQSKKFLSFSVGYFKFLHLDRDGKPELGKTPLLEICLVPGDRQLAELKSGSLYTVPVGSIVLQLKPGDHFPDIYNDPAWAAQRSRQLEDSEAKDVRERKSGLNQLNAPQRLLGAPEDEDFIDQFDDLS